MVIVFNAGIMKYRRIAKKVGAYFEGLDKRNDSCEKAYFRGNTEFWCRWYGFCMDRYSVTIFGDNYMPDGSRNEVRDALEIIFTQGNVVGHVEIDAFSSCIAEIIADVPNIHRTSRGIPVRWSTDELRGSIRFMESLDMGECGVREREIIMELLKDAMTVSTAGMGDAPVH